MERSFRIALAVICVLACLAGTSFAGFSLPPEVYRIGSLRDARQKANSMNVPIVFIYSNENSRCGLAKQATMDVIQELKGSAVIVYVSKNDSARIPGNIIKAMNSSAAGKFIPKTVAADPGTGKVLMIIPYISNRSQRIQTIDKIKNLTPK